MDGYRTAFPFGVGLPFRIVTFTPTCYREARLPKQPDLPRLPVLGIISLSDITGPRKRVSVHFGADGEGSVPGVAKKV
jgi:hypothetical protein